MKRPFPVHRGDTITRANIVLALLANPDLTTPEALAAHFQGSRRIDPRHVRRAEALRVWTPQPVTDQPAP